MQKVAAWLLERVDGMNWPEARADEASLLRNSVMKWLESKGADQAGAGTYIPKDGSSGKYEILDASDGERTWWLARLEETNERGRRMAAAVSITNGLTRVSVYVTLAAGAAGAGVKPAGSDPPRCPHLVRSLFELEGRWYHGASVLERRRTILGFENGEGLAAEIQSPDRTVPIVAVSSQQGALALPSIDLQIAYDLAGLANVVIVDEGASWALTDVLGREFGCYSGAVRLYWPQCSRKSDPLDHPYWSASKLRPGVEMCDRLRRQLRDRVFRAAAWSVVRPREIEAIRDAARQRPIAELKARASSLEEFSQLADSYAEESEALRSEKAELKAELQQEIKDRDDAIAELEEKCNALRAHLAAKLVLAGDQGAENVDEPDVDGAASLAPRPGETRFYKKVHSLRSRDVMVPVADCGCNHWQGGNRGFKAKNGIEHLEGRRGWRTAEHCAACTGGGMWRVRW